VSTDSIDNLSLDEIQERLSNIESDRVALEKALEKDIIRAVKNWLMRSKI